MKLKKILGFILASSTLVLLNQNCGNYSSNEFAELSATHSPTILDIDLPSYKTRLGDRTYVASVLAQAFLPTGDPVSKTRGMALVGDPVFRHIHNSITSSYNDANDQSIVDVIQAQILEQSGDFGGPCNFVAGDQTCTQNRNDQASRLADANRDIIANSTSVREGYRVNACTQLVASDRAVRNLILNVTGDRDASFSYDEHAEGLYNMFYTRPFNEDIDDGLGSLYSSISANGEANLDVWRLMASAVCKSPGWQIP